MASAVASSLPGSRSDHQTLVPSQCRLIVTRIGPPPADRIDTPPVSLSGAPFQKRILLISLTILQLEAKQFDRIILKRVPPPMMVDLPN